MERLKRKVGLLGFSANPPHVGHLEAARLILKRKLADAVWFVPCYRHSLNKELASAQHRWKMALLLEDKEIQASNIEFRLKGKSYTIETVRALQKEYPCCEFFWIVGSDIVKSGSYKRWRNWQELISLIDFLVVSRPGFNIKRMPEGFIRVSGRICNKVSSTEVRERIKRGLPIDGLVPPKVQEYIEKHGLYSSQAKL